jgi:putative membrane protein
LRRYSLLYAGCILLVAAIFSRAIQEEHSMRECNLSRLGAVVAVLCMTSAVLAQSNPTPAASNPRPAASPTTPSPPAPGSTGADGSMGTGASAKPGSLAGMAKYDGGFVRDAAQANMAEVALGNLAQKKAASASVKAFGRKMVTDHTKSYDELAKIAGGKGAVVLAQPNAAQERTAAKLAKLSGVAFDRAFAKVMVADHKKAVSLFNNEASNGRDADIKAFASSTLPTLEDHLKMAQQLAANPQAKM